MLRLCVHLADRGEARQLDGLASLEQPSQENEVQRAIELSSYKNGSLPSLCRPGAWPVRPDIPNTGISL